MSSGCEKLIHSMENKYNVYRNRTNILVIVARLLRKMSIEFRDVHLERSQSAFVGRNVATFYDHMECPAEQFHKIF